MTQLLRRRRYRARSVSTNFDVIALDIEETVRIGRHYAQADQQLDEPYAGCAAAELAVFEAGAGDAKAVLRRARSSAAMRCALYHQ